ncbi:hypothetical protein L3Y34_002223 [Caenorhabditis briggsae]|uniref:Uncharacterized protein n=1 Tax=Caenorhabditis briggsae TaxID=6238 RepID=A0AAE9IR68_CAEBR|nr:hypothetical protein L3Y34_002223 [Caenorhabditis briggsae]
MDNVIEEQAKLRGQVRKMQRRAAIIGSYVGYNAYPKFVLAKQSKKHLNHEENEWKNTNETEVEVRDVAGYLKRTSVRSLLKSQPEKRKQDHEDAENLENRHGSSKRQRVPKRQWSE